MLMDTPLRRLIERDGACGPGDWKLFVSDDAAAQEAAKRICESCQVRDTCLSEYFHEVGIVVGGMSWSERKTLITSGNVDPTVRERLVGVVRHSTRAGLGSRYDLTAEEATQLTRTYGAVA
jgi:hypothetical protein